VKHRDEPFRELYADDQDLAEEAPETAGEATCVDGSSTLNLTELADEPPSLYEEGELRAAVQKESYGFQVSKGEGQDAADSSGAISLPSCDSDDESFRLCGLADTISRK
jgi:hypothetical protein